MRSTSLNAAEPVTKKRREKNKKIDPLARVRQLLASSKEVRSQRLAGTCSRH